MQPSGNMAIHAALCAIDAAALRKKARFARCFLRFVAKPLGLRCDVIKVAAREQTEPNINPKQSMEQIMKNFLNVHSRQSNSFAATAFGVVVTVLLIGGYEATQSVTDSEMNVAQAVQAQQVQEVAKLETIVVTAKRI